MIKIEYYYTGMLHDCHDNDMKYASTNGIILDETSIIDWNQDQGTHGWYKYIDIDSIGISYHYDLSMSSTVVFEEGLEAIDIPDDTTVVHSNVSGIFQLEDPKKFKLYEFPRTQMYGGAKCAITNNLHPL